MATIATMAMLKPAAAKIVARSTPSTSSSSISKAPMSVSLRSLPRNKAVVASSSSASAASMLAGAFFSTLASSDAAVAAQQVADVASDAGSGDGRGTLLLAVVAPAIGWVLYNILQPALNQLNRMRSQGVVVGAAGLGGLGAAAAAGLALAPEASAATARDLVASLAAAAAPAGDDNRGTLLLIVVAPAIAWVLYNILQPALNQLNRMRND